MKMHKSLSLVYRNKFCISFWQFSVSHVAFSQTCSIFWIYFFVWWKGLNVKRKKKDGTLYFYWILNWKRNGFLLTIILVLNEVHQTSFLFDRTLWSSLFLFLFLFCLILKWSHSSIKYTHMEECWLRNCYEYDFDWNWVAVTCAIKSSDNNNKK